MDKPSAKYLCNAGLNLIKIKVGTQRYCYHTVWLRHNCRCDKYCLHPKTRELVVCSSSFTEKHTTPMGLYVAREMLFVRWMDGHESTYTLDWLMSFSDTASSYLPANLKPNESILFWNVTGDMGLVVQKVEENGYCVVRNFGVDNKKLVRLLEGKGYPLFPSHFGQYENLEPAEHNTFNKNTDQLGYTHDMVDMHTDQPFLEDCPPFQALHCIWRAEKGGSNMIVDVSKIYKMMTECFPIDVQILTTQPVQFHRKQKEFEKKLERTIIKLDPHGNFKSVRSSYFTTAPFDLPFGMMMPFYNAYNRFHEMVRKAQVQLEIQLDPGDFILYNNHRMMHGRTAFTGYRLMKGTYHTKAPKTKS